MTAQRMVLVICTDGKVRTLDREVESWDLGCWPDLPPENEDNGQGTELEDF